MKDDFENVYELIEHALELAFEGKMQLKFYEFLKYRKTTKAEIDAFLRSSTAKELADEVEKTLSLIEKLIPLQLISSDYAEDPKNLITEELTIKEIVDQAKNIIDYYIKQGLSEEESYTVLQEISFFRDNWESIKDNL